jgi:hypothetical protein
LALGDQWEPEVWLPASGPAYYEDLFANPVDKNGEGIADPNEHQTWYLIPDPEPQPSRQVIYTNQFGTQKLRAGTPLYLVVPTSKTQCVGGSDDGKACAFPNSCTVPGVCTMMPGPGTCTAPAPNAGLPCVQHSDCDIVPGDGVCGGLNHFECYEVTWAPHKDEIIVDLEDQFGLEPDVEVGDPRYFCNPTEKIVDPFGNPEVYPIEDPDNHLVCYDIEPKDDHFPLFVDTVDQFGPISLSVRTNEMLCVPSTKQGFALPTMGRWGFATLVGLLMLTTVAWVGYRRRPLAPGSAS